MKVTPVVQDFGPDDWMIGGTRDAGGERLFGFGPQDVAHAASIAYTEALLMDSRVTRDEFVGRIAGLLTQNLDDVLQAKCGH